ncbi:MAG: hypothetical protein LBC64_09635 [Fibromonadaceae bacterium]|jgi:hypothetical protein|nr:hypothetical protein [Fibromonadaceae bacterium]
MVSNIIFEKVYKPKESVQAGKPSTEVHSLPPCSEPTFEVIQTDNHDHFTLGIPKCCCCEKMLEKLNIEDCDIEIYKSLNIEDCDVEII